MTRPTLLLSLAAILAAATVTFVLIRGLVWRDPGYVSQDGWRDLERVDAV